MRSFTEFIAEVKITSNRLKKAGWPFKSVSTIPKDMHKEILDWANTKDIKKVPVEDINELLGALAKGKMESVEWQE